MPNDDGNLILDVEERRALLAENPDLLKFVLPLIGAQDFIGGGHRYCLWLKDAPPRLVGASTIISQRVRKNREYRSKSKRIGTLKLAEFPTLFGESRHTGQPFVLIPRHSSERRE